MSDSNRVANPLELVKLVNSLDEPLLLTIREGSLASLSCEPPKPLGLEVFLFALYRSYPERLLERCSSSVQFERLGEAVWPDQLRAPKSAEEIPFDSTGPAEYVDSVPAIFLEVEADLERILVNTVRMGSAMGHAKASITDFVDSVNADAAAVDLLKTKWGISFKEQF
jgi:hypothetical protein